MEQEAINWLRFIKLEGFVWAIAILAVMGLLARFVSRYCDRLGIRFVQRRLVIQQTGSFIRFGIYVAGFSAAIPLVLELNQQVWLAIGGSVAVAAGFAAKDIVASFLAGLIILVDRPFQVGDRVTYGGHYGDVTHIGLRSVRLMTLDDSQVTIPNNLFLTEPVVSGNSGSVDMMIQVDLLIGVDQDLKEARRLLSEVVTTSRYVNLNRHWSVGGFQVVKENYLAINLCAKAYVVDARLERPFQADITERALTAFAEAGILPPEVLVRR